MGKKKDDITVTLDEGMRKGWITIDEARRTMHRRFWRRFLYIALLPDIVLSYLVGVTFGSTWVAVAVTTVMGPVTIFLIWVLFVWPDYRKWLDVELLKMHRGHRIDALLGRNQEKDLSSGQPGVEKEGYRGPFT